MPIFPGAPTFMNSSFAMAYSTSDGHFLPRRTHTFFLRKETSDVITVTFLVETSSANFGVLSKQWGRAYGEMSNTYEDWIYIYKSGIMLVFSTLNWQKWWTKKIKQKLISWANSGWNQYLGGTIWVLAELIAQLKPVFRWEIWVLAELLAQLKPIFRPTNMSFSWANSGWNQYLGVTILSFSRAISSAETHI